MDPTPSQTIGPFFHLCLTRDLARVRAGGQRIRLECRVLDGEGVPVDDALIELWEAGAGRFARLATDGMGRCVFETVMPDGETPYINVSIFARGLLKRVVTRIYFSETGGDPILELVPAERRATLMAQHNSKDPSLWTFDIHLCGPRETVFFEF